LTFELTHLAAQIRGKMMPEPETIERAERDKAEGKSPSTQAGEFVREELHHVRVGKHGARSPQQAIAIGLSKARRAGVKLGPPKAGRSTNRVRKQAQRDLEKGRSGRRAVSPRRSRATEGAVKRESGSSASKSALSRQARGAARRRGHSSLHNAAMKAVHTKGKEGLRLGKKLRTAGSDIRGS
jgi:Family of unknown function (DUF6496)